MCPEIGRTVADAIRGRKLALVLAGGGLKGSYQLGVWRTLRKLNVADFQVIAGTSVGALNSVLFANGDYGAAREVWLKQDIVRPGPRGWLWFVAAYGFLFGPPVLSVGTFIVGLVQLITTRDPALWGVSFALALTSMLAAITIRVAVLDGPLFFQVDSTTMQLVLAAPLVILFPLGGLLALVVGTSPQPQTVSVAPTLSQGLGLLAFFALGCSSMFLVKWCLTQAAQSQLFQSDAIATAVSKYVDLPRLRSRVAKLFVTTSVGQSYLYPYRDNIRRESGPPPASYRVDTEHPPLENGWVAEYRDLCAVADRTEAIELLRRSSALPLVFRQGATASGQVVVDGGLADNVPYLPVLATEVEVIIIVLLSPDATLSAERIEQLLPWQWKTFRVPSLPPEAIVELYRDRFAGRAIPDTKWFSDMPSLQGRRVVVIGPALHLARWQRFPFLTGTLNLRRAARIKWFRQGYKDARKVLQALDAQSDARRGR